MQTSVSDAGQRMGPERLTMMGPRSRLIAELLGHSVVAKVPRALGRTSHHRSRLVPAALALRNNRFPDAYPRWQRETEGLGVGRGLAEKGARGVPGRVCSTPELMTSR